MKTSQIGKTRWLLAASAIALAAFVAAPAVEADTTTTTPAYQP